jgi:hypothetical protein
MTALTSIARRFSAFAFILFSLAASAFADAPAVSFDLGYMVECYDVTPQAFALLHPDEKIIEADLRVSVRMEKGEQKDVEQLQFEFTSPGERLRVIDFMPRTQIEAEATDPIEVVKTSETVRAIGGTLGGTVSLSGGNSHVTGVVATSALPAGNANATHRNELKETTKKTPPGKVVVASGTLANEHGVFFKLHQSSAASFEGIKRLSFRFVVPSRWSGDWVVLSCQATGTVKRWFTKSTELIGESKAFLALYVSGNTSAEQAALALAETQERYLAVASSKDHEIMIVDALAMEARPWRQSAPVHTPSSAKTLLSHLKPVTSSAMLNFPAGEKPPTQEAAKQLKLALDGVAHLSAFPGTTSSMSEMAAKTGQSFHPGSRNQ